MGVSFFIVCASHAVWLTACVFLVACYATLHPAMSVRWLVGRLVGWSVARMVGRSDGWSPFYFFGVFELFEHTAPAQMP